MRTNKLVVARLISWKVVEMRVVTQVTAAESCSQVHYIGVSINMLRYLDGLANFEKVLRFKMILGTEQQRRATSSAATFLMVSIPTALNGQKNISTLGSTIHYSKFCTLISSG
jgi:hypothetical protein